jgi:hypothetical protein
MESSPEAALNLLPGYDRVAVEYTRRFCDEMDTKPFDRKGSTGRWRRRPMSTRSSNWFVDRGRLPVPCTTREWNLAGSTYLGRRYARCRR